MKVITFCLWGSNPKYTIGAIKNAKLAKTVYPEWECWFYIADDVPKDIKDELQKTSKLIPMGAGNFDSMMWRFLPISDPSVNVFLSRDTDSRLNLREKVAVEEWLKEGTKLHVMRDHRYHDTAILGGMWGFNGTIVNDINVMWNNFIKAYGSHNHMDIDQAFLRHIIYPKYNNDCTEHDEMFKKYNGRPFPTMRVNTEYVGANFDENDNRLTDFVS